MNSRVTRSTNGGAAALELAFVLLASWMLIVMVWILGNIILQRSIIRAAALNAAELIASATPAELASADTIALIEQRAEEVLREAIERGGNEVLEIDIDRNSRSFYPPDLQTVEVKVEANIGERVFPNAMVFGGVSERIVVEVPYGGRLAGP